MSGPSGSTGAAPSSAAEDARALFQERLSLYARMLFALCVALLVVILAVQLVFIPERVVELFLHTSRMLHLSMIALMGAIWLRTRRGARSLAELEALDVFGSLLAYAIIAWLHATGAGLEAVLALTNAVIARAVLVPSAPRRTIALGAAGMAGLMLAGLLTHVPTETEPMWGLMVLDFCWSLFAIGIAAVASDTIYGLRAEVREARQLGQYVLEARLGAGGMGVVYKARHALLRRPTAVKLLPPDRAGAATLERFEREVRATARLHHPSTVQVFDYGRTPDGVFYYAMELLEGWDLEVIVDATGPMPPARVVHVLAQVCGSLAEAHALGLIHRDIKPANVVITERAGEHDVVKVVDFGLVKEIDASAVGVSRDGAITGTPMYLAPESISGSVEPGPSVDLHALGAVGYFLLTGTHVFPGKNVVEICADHLHTKPERPSERLGRELPEDLESLILQCLAKKPPARPSSARALRDALAKCDVGTWTQEDARAFFAEHAAALELARAKRAGGSGGEAGKTLAIDLARRT